MRPNHIFRLATALGFTGLAAHGAVLVTSGSLNTAIPDNDNTGVAHSLAVVDPGFVSSVSVSLNLSVPAGQTGWFGDLYAYVQHGSGLAVLLNRPGRTDANPTGYDDGQSVSLTFSPFADNGDIHNYRSVVGAGESTALTASLTGEWQPSGRATDPAFTLDTDNRAALLDTFTGKNVTGDWTLFLADVSGGSQYQLDSWSLAFEVSPVPEPGLTTLATSLGLGGWLLWRKRKSRPGQ